MPTTHAVVDPTPRELDVLGRLGQGMSDADVAAAPVTTEATAETHVSREPAELGRAGGCRPRSWPARPACRLPRPPA